MSRLRSLLTNPALRPQLVVWMGVIVLVAILFTAFSTIATTTNWFCTEPCHMVHYDNTLAFNAGSHVKQSCGACHEPLNGSPLHFILMKLEVTPDLIPTIAGTFSLPMNENHSVAFAMPEEQCTQCHNLANRTVNPSAGIIINHDVHTGAGISCTSCHNRVAHPEENVTYTLEGDRTHENWMSMSSCFRCHSAEAGSAAPGECAACHPADFNLVPATHAAPGWYQEFGESGGHAVAGSEEASRVAGAVAWAEGLEEIEKSETVELGYERSVNACYTCHTRQFCTDCHGVEMPHPADFATNHGDAGQANPTACATCHARSEAETVGTEFCNACHHPLSVPTMSWLDQHYVAVRQTGAAPCLECHNPRYCSACHVGGPEAAQEYLRERSGN
jgi:nitrate/TMAO reductase-like tetraheme cytochrome c subunit